jgi:hypothetical protein
VSPGHGPDGLGSRLSQGGASPQAEGEVYSAKSELRILFGGGSSEEGDAPPRGEARPSLDGTSPDLPLLQSPVAANCGGLRHQGPAGGGTASTFGDISMSGMEFFSVTLCF